jgi:hypothetical protein
VSEEPVRLRAVLGLYRLGFSDMSSADRLLLILHIGFAIFTLGPLTAATMATPRYIRRGEPGILRYLNRATRIYGLLTPGIFLFGALLQPDRLGRGWLSASMTLFVVAFVLLIIVERDQRKAINRIEAAGPRPAPGRPAVTPPEGTPAATEGVAEEPAAGTTAAATGAGGETSPRATAAEPALPAAELAKVELGRIATISGVVALIWIVILVLMVVNA